MKQYSFSQWLGKNSFGSPDIYAGNPGAFHKSRAQID
jgi:hypothetical protein